MYVNILFNPIMKYISIFIITFMFMNNVGIPMNRILIILFFTLLLNITMDLFIFDDYIKMIKTGELLYDVSV